MRKEEFLQTLRRALTGDVPPGVVEENIRYYDSYITEEVRKGRTEEEVTGEIGDPRLIARTIEDTTDGAGEGRYQTEGSYAYGGSGDTSQRGGYGSDPYSRSPYGESSQGRRRSFSLFRMDKWYGKLMALLVVFAVIYVVFSIIGGIFALLMPFIGPLFMIWLIVTIIRNSKRRW
ncbi:MAG: DUF1700 domain-containing protein [Hungatella sp.]|jgi:hypothetical protein|nr:DUF1700 domain-containing protein [Hungatella sp.]